jgi:hypothetical protein
MGGGGFKTLGKLEAGFWVLGLLIRTEGEGDELWSRDSYEVVAASEPLVTSECLSWTVQNATRD